MSDNLLLKMLSDLSLDYSKLTELTLRFNREGLLGIAVLYSMIITNQQSWHRYIV